MPCALKLGMEIFLISYSCIKATQTVLKIFRMDRYFLDSPRTLWKEI